MIKVYGASDDLIVIEGDVEEEFPYHRDIGWNFLGFSNGVILKIQLGAGAIWEIRPVLGSAYVIEQCTDEGYSDVATIPLAYWVVHGIDYARKGGGK